jgi:hypothetical protein
VPVPVDPIRDSFDWILFWTQLGSLLITLLAVVLAFSQIVRTKKDARNDRRIDFELTVLLDLVVAVEQVDGLRVRALASTLPKEVLPITRAVALLPSTEEADDIVQQLEPDSTWPEKFRIRSNLEDGKLKDQVATELVQAIDKRAREREPTR